MNGNIRITGVGNDVAVGGVNGNIDVLSTEGGLDAGLVNGNITADLTLPTGSDVALGTVNGNLTLTVQKDANANLSASWVNGGFSSQNITINQLETTPTTVRGRLGIGGVDISLGTTNGQIALRGRD